MRTDDVSYGQHYWDSLDGGGGYRDSVMWADIAHAIFEVFLVDRKENVDRSGSFSCVDVGCAFGYLVRHLRHRGMETWGLDYSTYALERAPEDVRSFLRWFDLAGPNGSFFGRDRFPLLTCLETLEHVPEEHVGQALGHLWDLLSPGGTAVLAICTSEREGWETDPTHVTIHPAAWWASKLADQGFERVEAAEEKLRFFWLFSAHPGIFVVRRPEQLSRETRQLSDGAVRS